MNIAIASPASSAYSETFIAMQMESLPCKLRIHGSNRTLETVPGGPIVRNRSLRKLIAAVFPRRGHSLRRVELVRRLKEQQISVILANFGPTGVELAPICKEMRIPLVVHFHGYDAHRKDLVAAYTDGYKELGRIASAFLAVSTGMQNALVEIGIPKHKIHLTRCCVDPDRFPQKVEFAHNPVFFGIGRFVDKKAPYLTLLAFARAHTILPNARLILAGDGELLETTRNICSALGLDDSVLFPGVLTHEAVSSFMRDATAFVQHSLEPRYGASAGDREGTPVAVLEAMMSGVPVISTKHAGIGEVVEDNRSGLLVGERDIEGMCSAMIKLGRSPVLAATMGRAARARALENYTKDHYLKDLTNVLNSVL